jgi:hypothetical protein
MEEVGEGWEGGERLSVHITSIDLFICYAIISRESDSQLNPPIRRHCPIVRNYAELVVKYICCLSREEYFLEICNIVHVRSFLGTMFWGCISCCLSTKTLSKA